VTRRYSHDDPAYKEALQQMAHLVRKKLDEKNWTQAELVRRAGPFMPKHPETGKPRRLSDDNISNMVNGKRRPTRNFVIAVSKAFECADEDFMPKYLLERWSPPAEPSYAASLQITPPPC